MTLGRNDIFCTDVQHTGREILLFYGLKRAFEAHAGTFKFSSIGLFSSACQVRGGESSND